MIRPDSRMSAVLALLLLVPAPSLGVYIAMMAAQGQPLGWTAYALCKVWIIALPVLWLVFVDKGKLSLSPVRQGGLRFGLGLGALLTLYPPFHLALKIAGGAWLLYLAWKIGTARSLSDGGPVAGAPMTFLQAALFT